LAFVPAGRSYFDVNAQNAFISKIVSHTEAALHGRVWIRFVSVGFNHHTAATFCERFTAAKVGSCYYRVVVATKDVNNCPLNFFAFTNFKTTILIFYFIIKD
jgi:hypothetical protein